MLRRPLFGRHGKLVVAALCGWELVAIAPRAPIPTISQIVTKRRAVGVALLIALFHHWYLEES